jgi:hypothetical protein
MSEKTCGLMLMVDAVGRWSWYKVIDRRSHVVDVEGVEKTS